MKRQLLSIMLHELATIEAPAESINLTSSIIASAKREHSHQRRATLILRLTVGIATLLFAAIGLMVLVPSAGASLDGVLRRFGLVLAPEETTRNHQGMLLAPTFYPVTPVPVTLGEIMRQAPFVVRHPSILPEGLVYETGHIDSRADGSVQVLLLYRDPAVPGYPENPEVPLMMFGISDGDLGPIYLSEEAALDTTVGQHPAIYIRGGWTTAEPVEPGETFQGLFWDYTFNDHYLTWEQDGLVYRIQIHHVALDMESVIRIAESLK